MWSRRDGGAYEVVSAPLQSAHGALLLGGVTLLARGGAVWIAAAEWSPDARSLVVVQGNPFAPLAARGIDFATGSSVELGDAIVPGGAAFAPIAARLERDRPLCRRTALQVGSPSGVLQPLPVPGVDDWGAPTGVSMSADGVTPYLAQRSADGEHERLVEIRRDCR